MDKIDKFLNKLRHDEKLEVEKVLNDVYSGSWQVLKIKKLKGFEDRYRARKGRVRLIFRLLSTNPIEIKVLSIGNRDDNTYKF